MTQNGVRTHPFDLESCARPNILRLEPYRCARDDYEDNGVNILLDANENAFGPGLSLSKKEHPKQQNVDLDFDLHRLHRYPDPHQAHLKELWCRFRNTHRHTPKILEPENVFVGVGSDEAIDAILRCFCRPGADKMVTCPPTYGMYGVSAQVNDVEVVKVPLDAGQHFSLRPQAVNEALSADPSIKVVYLCSPGNPTANRVAKDDLEQILRHPTWNGVVVLDEAYIDFAPDDSSLAEWVTEWPNLVVMQTLSKAFGLAGIRLGAAFTSAPIARLLNSLKAPYNISSPTSALAIAALQPENLSVMRNNRAMILQQRDRLLRQLPEIPGIGRFLGGADANFLLVEVLDRPSAEGGHPSNEIALAVYERLAEKQGIVVRFRGREAGCLGCLRITVGTEEEVDRLIQDLSRILTELTTQSSDAAIPQKEPLNERRANGVVA